MSSLTDNLDTIWDAQLGCFDSETVTISGVDYACGSGEERVERDLMEGGYFSRNGVTLGIKTSLFGGTLPTLQTLAVFNSKNWVIDRIRHSSDRTVTLLDLVPSHT